MYGKELIIDLYMCDKRKFNRTYLKKFYNGLCKTIDMQPCKQTFWDDKWTWLWKIICFWDRSIQPALELHTCGTSSVQFILTSNITVHTLDKLGEVYINIFSCKEFDIDAAVLYASTFFDTSDYEYYICPRGKKSFYNMKETK